MVVAQQPRHAAARGGVARHVHRPLEICLVRSFVLVLNLEHHDRAAVAREQRAHAVDDGADDALRLALPHGIGAAEALDIIERAKPRGQATELVLATNIRADAQRDEQSLRVRETDEVREVTTA